MKRIVIINNHNMSTIHFIITIMLLSISLFTANAQTDNVTRKKSQSPQISNTTKHNKTDNSQLKRSNSTATNSSTKNHDNSPYSAHFYITDSNGSFEAATVNFPLNRVKKYVIRVGTFGNVENAQYCCQGFNGFVIKDFTNQKYRSIYYTTDDYETAVSVLNRIKQDYIGAALMTLQ